MSLLLLLGGGEEAADPVVSYGGGTSRLAFQVFTDPTMATMIADWTHVQVGTVFETDDNGFGSLTTFIPMTRKKAEYFYTATPLAHIVVSNGASVAYEGRIEDRAITNGGLEISAFGYQQALTDLDYLAFWSSTTMDEWRIMTKDDRTLTRSDKYTVDKNNRIYMALKSKGTYTTSMIGRVGWPVGGRKDFAYATYGYDVTLPANVSAKLISTIEGLDSATATEEWVIAGNGGTQSGTAIETLAADSESLFFQIEPTGDYEVGNDIIGVQERSRPDLTEAYQNLSANNKYATQFTATSTFTATKMSTYLINFNTGEKCRLGIYSDSTGSPNALLGETGDILGYGRTGVYTADLDSGVALTSGTVYWLAIIVDSACSTKSYTASHTSDTNADTFVGGFADPWGSSSAQTYGLVITAFADDWFVEITNLRVTATDGTVYADEIVADIVSYVSGTNSTQLSSSTALIDSPTVDLNDAIYFDESPHRIVTDLAAIGDNSTPPKLYEWGVWENQRLHFRLKGSQAQEWYIDAADFRIDSTVDTLVNSTYGIYRDARGFTRRTADSTDAASIAKYGITRHRAVQTPTTDVTEAGIWRDTVLEDNKDITPRTQVKVKEVFTASGARVKKWQVRAGHNLTARNFSPTGSSELDKVSSFRLSRTRYHVDTDVLEPTPEEPTTTLDVLVAQHAAKLR